MVRSSRVSSCEALSTARPMVFSLIMLVLLLSVLLTRASGVVSLYVLQGFTPLLSVMALTWLTVSLNLQAHPGSILAAMLVPAGVAASVCCTLLLTILYAWLLSAGDDERCFELAVGLKAVIWLYGLCRFPGRHAPVTKCQLKPSTREMEGFGSETVSCCGAEP